MRVCDCHLICFACTGLSTFLAQVKNKNVVIWSDNTAAEAATRKGSAREFDQGAVIHSIWKLAALNNIGIWVNRVPTKDNIADDPSRERYGLLAMLGATFVKPVLFGMFEDPRAWNAVSLNDDMRG